ncbi:DoxX family protein [Ferruginibacter profundus]
MKRFPFFTLRQTLVLLRYAVAFVFLAHAVVRIINKTIPQFTLFLENKGFLYGTIIVWAITVFEIAGSILLAAGYFTKWLSAGFILMLLIGIILIHASLGWFVGEHGTGGCEYSFILIICLLVLASENEKL